MPDMKRGIRGNKLGDGYGKAELIERIDVAVKEKAAFAIIMADMTKCQ